jgi:hypothetical protein
MLRLVFILAAIGLLIGFVYTLGRRFGRDKAIDDVAKTFGGKLIEGTTLPASDVELAVWGEAQKNADGSTRQEIIAKLSEGDEIELIRQRDNSDDANTVAVVSEKGEIGRLNRGDAATLAPYLDRGGRVRAQVSAIRGGTRDRPELNVWILVRALDEI